MTESYFNGPIAFVDVETTGGHAGRNRIIDIAIVACNDGELEYEWSTLVNPGQPIPASIQHYTGITEEMVRGAPFFEDIIGEVADRLEDRLLVAHNARFDYGFLRAEFARMERKFASRVACTVKLSRRLYPERPRHNLDAVIEHHNLNIHTRHRALPDAQALWQFWCAVRNERSVEELEDVLLEIMYLKSLPAHLPATLPDELPEGHGVYRFYGESDALLYVGKANNVRQRVLQHWQGAARDTKSQKLAELTRRVEWTPTAGELGALLLEARQVRELKPLYNRKLRGAKQVLTWMVADDGAAPKLVPLDCMPLSFENSDAFGLFRSEAAARKTLTQLARDEELCLKALGLERCAGSCFAYQLGRCAGACVGEESLRLHAVRLKIALASERVRPWPYKGPIGIREASNELEHVHVIDEWRHLGTLEDGDALPVKRRYQSFDLEVYRILVRRLSDASRLKLVKLFEESVESCDGELVTELDPEYAHQGAA